MDQTALLALPYILPSQAQKHVTHNEALRMLDAIIHLRVEDRNRETPPASPTEGQRHALGAAPTGAFAGKAGKIAAFQDGAWSFLTPRAGWVIWCEAEAELLVHDGTGWQLAAPDPTTLLLLGINATADATNRLSVSAAATLLSHEGAGHQLKLNKAASGQTGSLLFQTAWSGRAELGLAGSDDFSFKVSADGTTWKTALSMDRTSGAVAVDKLGIGTTAPASEVHLLSTRTSGLAPHLMVQAGKLPGSAGSVAYQRANSSQQTLFVFETGSSSNPDGYVGTLGGKTGAVYMLAGNGSGSVGAIGVDSSAGLRIGTSANIASGSIGASITPAGQTYLAGPVGIGTASPHASAQLELSSTIKGFLPPRLTTTQRDAIASPATGLIIFNTTDVQPQFWNGSAWVGMN